MLNGTLCATERALCCIVENYQTPEVSSLSMILQTANDLANLHIGQGMVIPEVLRPYMGGRDFLPYVKSDLPKGSASTKTTKKK
jgi:seryl-tRNA synthetase